MKTRILLGSILILLLTGLFTLDHFLPLPLGFLALALVVSSFCCFEVSKLLEKNGVQADMWVMLISGSGMLLTLGLWDYGSITKTLISSGALISGWIGFVLFITAFTNLWGKEPQTLVRNFIGTILCFTYVFVPVALLLSIRKLPVYGESLLFYLLIVCRLGADSGAYFFGKAFGKRKLIPKISPGKTIEGVLGGSLASLVLGCLSWVVMSPLHQNFGIGFIALLSLFLSFVNVHGDLFASALKRSANVKDSSSLFPEFGGILDLIDGLLFSAPLLYLALVFRAL